MFLKRLWNRFCWHCPGLKQRQVKKFIETVSKPISRSYWPKEMTDQIYQVEKLDGVKRHQ